MDDFKQDLLILLAKHNASMSVDTLTDNWGHCISSKIEVFISNEGGIESFDLPNEIDKETDLFK